MYCVSSLAVALITFLDRLLPSQIGAVVTPKLLALLSILLNEDGNKGAERTALFTFAIRVASAALAFISQIILARAMGEFEYGIFVFVWVFVIIAGNFSCLGFHSVVIRFISQYNTTNDHNHIRGLTRTARFLAMILATIVAGSGIAGILIFADSIPTYYLVPFILGACALPMIALGDVLDGTARANNWPIAGLGPVFIIRPTLIILFVLAALLLGFEANAKTALIAALVATYITAISQLMIISTKLKKRYDKGALDIDLKKWIIVALPIFFIEGFYYLLTIADVVIVGFFLEPDKVAVYFAAAKTMALVHFVYYAVKTGAAAKFATLSAENKTSELDEFAIQTARWTFIPTLLVGGAVLLLGNFLLSLFGEAFTEGYSVMLILFVGILAKSLIGPGEILLAMSGRQKICTFIYAFVVVCIIGLNFALIPIYGINGAAMATSGAMIVESILLLIVVKMQLGIFMFALNRIKNNVDPAPVLTPNGESST